MKKIEFLGDTKKILSAYSFALRKRIGFALEFVQKGDEPPNWKPMPSIGQGVNEIRVRDEFGIYRVIYIAKIKDAIYILNIFQKKTQKTEQHDLELAKTRLKSLSL
jgi:phage-related protein